MKRVATTIIKNQKNNFSKGITKNLVKSVATKIEPSKHPNTSYKESYSKTNNASNILIFGVGAATVGSLKILGDNLGKHSNFEPQENSPINNKQSSKEKLKSYFLKRTNTENNKTQISYETKSKYLDLIEGKNIPPLILDIMQIIADEDLLHKIILTSEKKNVKSTSGINILSAELSPANDIFIYGVNKRSTDEILSSIVHEASHIVQNHSVEKKMFSNNPFEDGSLFKALKKDKDLNPKSDTIKDLFDDIREYDEIEEKYGKNRHGFEIHSRVMELYYENSEETKKLLPNTLNEITKAHEHIKSSLRQKGHSFVDKLFFNNNSPSNQISALPSK